MDINTKISIQNDKLPTRFLNQIDDSRTVEEKYLEYRKEMIETLTNSDDEETKVHITFERKNV